jgi:uncharacterized damage-inducible protein DinB
MSMAEAFLAQLDAETPRTRRALENTPEGRDEWTPHEKSMPFGRLANLVAQMPMWIDLIVSGDELEIAPEAGESSVPQTPLRTPAELVAAMDKGVAAARKALEGATDEHLKKPWRLLVKGNVVSEEPRYIVIRDTFSHLAHHRGQFTVYLRMNEAKVPAIYGPSADDQTFA